MNMNDYERIQNAVQFIEEHLQNDLNITDIAAKSCFSPFHFQRLFQAISGFSVYQYIRNRRLSEAALLLEKTDRSILDIAINFGYGSQEAFSRAFSQYFGITPAKYRKAKVKLDFQSKINFLEYKERMTGDMNIPKPHITHLNDIHMIGYEYRTNLNDEKYFEDIPKFYNDFGRNGYFMQIPQKRIRICVTGCHAASRMTEVSHLLSGKPFAKQQPGKCRSRLFIRKFPAANTPYFM